MEIYQAVNIMELYNIEEMRQKNIECWLLYQVCETSGVDIKVISSESMPLTIPDVQLESLCYILYKKGEYYHLEGLMDQLEQNQINMEQILLKKAFDTKISEEMSSRLKAETVKSFRFPKIVKSEMIANQNGYCIFYPIIPAATMGGFAIGEELREFEICYRPNSKKLHNVFLDKILGYIPSKTKELDYMEYFAKTLEDEQMLLNEEKCLELYSVLEGNTKSFAMNGGETYIFKKDRHVYPELYLDDKKFTAARNAFENTDEFFRWWIIGRMKRNVNTAITCGMLYEIA